MIREDSFQETTNNKDNKLNKGFGLQKQPKTEEQKKQQSQKILIRSFNG